MFEEFLKRPVSWITDSEENIIFSSRIRLARNLADFPFPEKANSSEREEVRERIKSAILKLEEFGKVFFGEGNNSAETPIQNIYRKADYLSLFAVTLGKKVSDKIREFFRKNDFALGHLLDCIASLAADNMVRKLENLNTENLGILYQQLPRLKHRNHRKDIRTLAYSPGYCGWHISGQKKLFEFLKPEKIGITLNDSFLMIPLKSISGVLISGKREIHQFKNNFSFCSMCKTKSCLERM